MEKFRLITLVQSNYSRALFAGALLPLSFAPFHLSGMAFISLALMFDILAMKKPSFLLGFLFGLSYFGLGVSWIFVSIKEYGHLNLFVALLITALFISYLSIFTGLASWMYQRISSPIRPIYSLFIFAAVWCFCEWLRASVIGGFPWLTIGFGQIDSPLKALFPILGVYGLSFIVAFLSGLLSYVFRCTGLKRIPFTASFLAILFFPEILSHSQWVNIDDRAIKVSIIQANLSMRDKWDNALFSRLLETYKKNTLDLLKQTQLVILPETAIPLPSHYISEDLDELDNAAKKQHAAILLGIPKLAEDHTHFYNTVSSLGNSSGLYQKQHLVPFGEFIPTFLTSFIEWLGAPDASLVSGTSTQNLIKVLHRPIASLICYELAYPNLLRSQLPQAQWIVSISDDGWFGHSLAMSQHLQMAQVLSLMTERYQIMANNDGLSSIINAKGDIIASLPAYHAGILQGTIYPARGPTPWVMWGDAPVQCFFCLVLLLAFPLAERRKRGYSYQPD